jgi:hypothetical protein
LQKKKKGSPSLDLIYHIEKKKEVRFFVLFIVFPVHTIDYIEELGEFDTGGNERGHTAENVFVSSSLLR